MSTYRVIRRPGHTWEGDAETPMCAVVESGMFHTTTLIELTGETDGISRITATCSGDRLGSVYLLSEVPGHWEHSLTGDPYTMVWRGRSLAR